MKVSFVKMHGASNDFILVDEWDSEVVPNDKKSDFVISFCDRRVGVGADGVVFVHKSRTSDAKFIIYNPDGSQAEMDGNGIRCFGKYLSDNGIVDKTDISVETPAGVKYLRLTLFNDKVEQVRVDMGVPQLTRAEIGISGNGKDMFVDETVKVGGLTWKLTAVGTGNPHAVIFVEDVMKADVVGIGKSIRNMESLFKNGINVHFVQNMGKNEFRIRSYERGVEGETLACGTGVCASAVAAVLNRMADPGKTFIFYAIGGELHVELTMEGNRFERIFLIGPAVEVYRGELEYDPSEKFQAAAYTYVKKAIKQSNGS